MLEIVLFSIVLDNYLDYYRPCDMGLDRQIAGQTEGHKHTITRFITGIEPVVNKN